LLAAVVASLICSATASAATSPTTACDRTTDLESLEVPVSELSANVVGHIMVESDEEDVESLAGLPTEEETALPILYLATRVAVILQDVFSAVAIETPPLDRHDPAQSFPIESVPANKSPLSPVAGDAGQLESSEAVDPDAAIEDVEDVPSIHRQMYRTDI
jgi:hypothetical protein